MPSLAWKRNRAYAVHYSTVTVTVEGQAVKKQRAKWIPLGKFKNKRDGKAAFFAHCNKGARQGDRAILFEDFVPIYKQWAKTQKSQTTLDEEEKHLGNLRTEFGDLRLDAITADVLLAYKEKYSAWAKTTMRNRLGLLKQLLALAHRTGYRIARDPDPFTIAKVPRPQVYEFKDKSVDPEAMAAIIQAISPKAHQALGMVLNYSGIRPIEAWRMDPAKHIDRKAWEFTLTPEVTKTSRSRTIPISQKIRACLGVFPITFTREAFAKSLARACKKAGYPEKLVTPGVFRHQFGHMVVNTGDRNIRAAQELMGHTKIELTARYAHPNKESLQRAVDSL